MKKNYFLIPCIFLSLLASGCFGLTADSYSNIQSETEGMYFYELADLTNSQKIPYGHTILLMQAIVQQAVSALYLAIQRMLKLSVLCFLI